MCSTRDNLHFAFIMREKRVNGKVSIADPYADLLITKVKLGYFLDLFSHQKMPPAHINKKTVPIYGLPSGFLRSRNRYGILSSMDRGYELGHYYIIA